MNSVGLATRPQMKPMGSMPLGSRVLPVPTASVPALQHFQSSDSHQPLLIERATAFSSPAALPEQLHLDRRTASVLNSADAKPAAQSGSLYQRFMSRFGMPAAVATSALLYGCTPSSEVVSSDGYIASALLSVGAAGVFGGLMIASFGVGAYFGYRRHLKILAEQSAPQKPAEDVHRSSVYKDFIIKSVSDFSNGVQTFQNAYLKQFGDGNQSIYNPRNIFAKIMIPFRSVRENPNSPQNENFLLALGSGSKIAAGALTLYRYSTMIYQLKDAVFNPPKDITPWRKTTYRVKTIGEIARAGSMIGDTVLFFGGFGLVLAGQTEIAFWSYLGANTFRIATSAILTVYNPFAYLDAVREDKDRLAVDPKAKPKNLDFENRAIQLTLSGISQTIMQGLVLYTVAMQWDHSTAEQVAMMESSSVKLDAWQKWFLGGLQFFGPAYAVKNAYSKFKANSGAIRKAYFSSGFGGIMECGSSILYSFPEYRFAAHIISSGAQLFKANGMRIQKKLEG